MKTTEDRRLNLGGTMTITRERMVSASSSSPVNTSTPCRYPAPSPVDSPWPPWAGWWAASSLASCSGLSYSPTPFQMLVTVLVSKRSSSRTMGEWSEREVMYVAYAGGQSWKPSLFNFSSRRAFLEDAESLDPAPCGPEPDHCCRQPRHVPLGQGGLAVSRATR